MGKFRRNKKIEKKYMNESIKKIFGPDVEYRDESFDDDKVKTFAVNSEKTEYSGGMYTKVVKQETGMSPLIYQEVQKVVRYSKKIIVYVKSAYIDVEDEKYVIYKDFSDDEFKNKLLEVQSGELFNGVSYNNLTGEGTISVEENIAINEVRNSLNTYKYTFNENNKEYYLSGFTQEKN